MIRIALAVALGLVVGRILRDVLVRRPPATPRPAPACPDKVPPRHESPDCRYAGSPGHTCADAMDEPLATGEACWYEQWARSLDRDDAR